MIRDSLLPTSAVTILITLLYLSSAATAQQNARPDGQRTGDEQNLDVQYAETYLRLAEARLRRADDMNQRIARSVSGEQMEELKSNYELAQQLVRSAQQGGKSGRQGIYLRLAELAVTGAQQELQRASAARQLGDRSIGENEMEILELRVQLARLNLEIGKRALAGPPEEDLRWKIGLLYEEVIRLREEVDMLKQRD